MNRLKNIDHAINILLSDTEADWAIPDTLPLKQRLMRALMNVRQPIKPSQELIDAQDKELVRQREEKGIVEIAEEGIQLWKGDITRIKVDAIVNAANSQMLGCFIPLHSCIDNAIHSAAGIQLRCACNEMMQTQGHEEPTGQAKITPGFNLPARYVIHTVGPIIPNGIPTKEQEEQLASCYRSCLQIAEEHGLKSIAFCCISTGVFRFPQRLAAEIAVKTIKKFSRKHIKTIVFNVFTDTDDDIYQQLI